MSKLAKVIIRKRRGKLIITAQNRAARGRTVPGFSVMVSKGSLEATLRDPEIQNQLGLKQRAAPANTG